MSEHNNEHEHLGHILPLKVYVSVLLCLFVLTFVTVAIAQFHFGAWNLVVAMLVASVKASLVAMFFMHLKYESPATWAFAIMPVVFLLVLIAGVYIDNPYRIVP